MANDGWNADDRGDPDTLFVVIQDHSDDPDEPIFGAYRTQDYAQEVIAYQRKRGRLGDDARIVVYDKREV